MKILKLTTTTGSPAYVVLEHIASVTPREDGTLVVGNGVYALVQETPELVIDMMTVMSPFRDSNDCNL